MKKILFVILFCISVSLNAQNQDSLWFRNNYIKKEIYITMRDGVKLFTSIYQPKDNTEKHPILLTRTPYTSSPYGEENYGGIWRSYKMTYLKEGYIIITQDVRGKWMSEGEFVDVRPFNPNKKGKEVDEASDTWDTVDWLVKNLEGNNGNVGVFGISYPGFYSTMAAASGHTAVKAVSPQAPVTNWFIGDDFHHNGACFQMDAFSFYSPAGGGGFGIPRPKPTKVANRSSSKPVFDSYKYYLETGSLKNLTKLTGDSIAFWTEMTNHPDYDDWWKARDARNATKNLKPAMLWVGGLFDAEDCWGAWNAYKAAEENNPGKEFNKIVEGPWSHGQWSGSDGTKHGNIRFGSNTNEYYQQKLEIPFFNYFLKGKGDVSQIAEANVFVTGANEWRTFDQWPPKAKTDKAFYLQASGNISFEKPGKANSFSEYVSDPAKPVPYEANIHGYRTTEYMSDDQRFAARRPDVLVFQTDILSDDVTVTGPVIADILTSISTTDADFVVKIIDVFPDDFSYQPAGRRVGRRSPSNEYPMGGYQMLVRGEVFRGRYRNSFEKPVAFTPDKVEEVKFELPSIAHCFKKGHRIMVQVQSSWFPLVDRNPQQFVDIYHCDESDFVKSNIKIYHDSQNASKIILPVLD